MLTVDSFTIFLPFFMYKTDLEMNFILRNVIGGATKQQQLRIRIGPSTSSAYLKLASEPCVRGYVVFFRHFCSRFGIFYMPYRHF